MNDNPASNVTAKLLQPVQAATSTVRRLPGADTVGGAVDGMLDKVGLVSPRARRMAAYAGAGILGVAGAVEWPVAAVGAAAVWLTQPRPAHPSTADSTRPSRTSAARSSRKSGPSASRRSGRSTSRAGASKRSTASSGSAGRKSG